METLDVVEHPETDRFCGAHKSTNGQACRNLAGYRTPHPGWGRCRNHGGSTAPGILAAAKEEANVALRQLPLFGELVDVTPHEALIFMVRRSAGMVSWLEAKMQTLGEESMVYVDQAQQQRPNAWLKLLNEERDRLVRYAKTAADAGVAERAIQLAEQQGAMVATLVQSVLDQLGLDTGQQQQANELLYHGLRQLGAGPPS